MVENKLKCLVGKIKGHYANMGVPEIEKTNVVSPLFPGQFNYCLDEVNVLEKYGDLVHIGDEHFQKIQPAIRLSDYHQQGVRGDHLGQFTIATTRGWHSPVLNEGIKEYDLAVKSLLSFFEDIGLDQDKLKVTYFTGNYAREVEASGKRDVLEQDLKVRVDKYLTSDNLAVPIWMENGLKENQFVGSKTRDNFLTSAWYVTLAPWGYRNEIFYEMPNGRDLDIATIERLTLYPTIEKNKDSKGRLVPYVTEIHDWDVGAVLDGFGVERNLLAIEEKEKIYDLSLFAPLNCFNAKNEEIESLRILHRIFTDSSWEVLSRQRKEKVKKLMRETSNLDSGEIQEILQINAESHNPLFSDLEDGIDKTIYEIESYRSRCK